MTERFPTGGFPAGWYVVRPSRQLKPGQVERVHYIGRDMVLYRSESGVAHLSEPICPHLGAHLALGHVQGENLVCGMHGFEFAGDGQCVKLAYGTRPPPGARIGHYPVHELDGFIFAYLSPGEEQPSWKLEALDWEGWTPLRHHRLELASHPQEITENSVDMGHFKAIHHYNAVAEEDAVADGEKLTAAYRIVRPWLGRRSEWPTFEVVFRVLAHGFGYSLIHADVQRTPISIRYFVNATPIDGERAHLNLAAAVRKSNIPGASSIIREAVFLGLRHDVSQDFPFWESKHHIERPLLAQGDGPIGTYRRWCRQFYRGSSRPESVQTSPRTPGAATPKRRAGPTPRL
jgi:nitrite reductase/ring-hydroxylating ferredoxin subunit